MFASTAYINPLVTMPKIRRKDHTLWQKFNEKPNTTRPDLLKFTAGGT